MRFGDWRVIALLSQRIFVLCSEHKSGAGLGSPAAPGGSGHGADAWSTVPESSRPWVIGLPGQKLHQSSVPVSQHLAQPLAVVGPTECLALAMGR